MKKTTLALLAATALPVSAQAASTEFTFGGFIKADAMYTQYSEDAYIKDLTYYIPGSTPTTATANNDIAFDTSLQASRFNFKTVTTLDNGEKVTAFIEMDFLGATNSKKITSPYTPRLRHAYFNYQNLTVGQTWSTFMNVGALPESVDLIGPSDGTVFVRQTVARYDIGGLQLALENSNTSENANKASSVPDLIARYNISTGEHSFSIAGLLRQLEVDTLAVPPATSTDESTLGYGVNVAGVIKLGDDNLKFSASYGDLGRYVGVGVASDIDATEPDFEGNKIFAGFVSYQHFWNSQLRSTLTYSMLDASDKTSSSSARVNLLYSPVKSLTYGVEFSHAELEKGSGIGKQEGDFNRLHFTAKYVF